jgi:hypothetical protein
MLCVVLATMLCQQQAPPALPPFPQPGPRTNPPPQTNSPGRPASPTTTAPPPATAPAPAPIAPRPGVPETPPTEAELGVPIYPGAQFIASYDASRGQRYYIFGVAAGFVQAVEWYRTSLKQKGELVYDVPATHEFDVGKYNEDTMAFPPGVTVKDYQSEISQGYPNPKPGAQPARFPTLLQIVPVTARSRSARLQPSG